MAPQLRAFIILLLPLVALAATTTTQTRFPIAPRRKLGKSLQKALELIGFADKQPSFESWDLDAYPDMCEIYMETKDGGNCIVKVKCKDSAEKTYDKWNVCYVGGRQYFTDPRIGEFSVTFTKKDGHEGEGLTEPLLRVKSVDNWRKLWVSKLTQMWDDYNICEAGSQVGCEKDAPFICGHDYQGNQPPDRLMGSRTKRWWCGVPRLNKPWPKVLVEIAKQHNKIPKKEGNKKPAKKNPKTKKLPKKGSKKVPKKKATKKKHS
ncbi:hypothetical protein AJ79_06788 [Helicocarpus griseus UAMH5409]|uniref:Uncharacterized protein n=1 Tax=Helicocarpus griseus UAMH5409 TaxID=1447875 RepID=A0A2B7X9P3_9EURO|nr:hypothetical protein AJ79_06788 [Helicocarpus griseus UAMH5409]